MNKGGHRQGCGVKRRGVVRVKESPVDSHMWRIGPDKLRQGRAVKLVGAG